MVPGITWTSNPSLTPTTTASKTSPFKFTSLHSKLFGVGQFRCLSKSDSLISLSRSSSSSSVVASAHVDGGGGGNHNSGDSPQIASEKGKNVEDMAVVGMFAMQKALYALEYFCITNFTFHGLDVNSPQTLFKFLPILLFTESYIYQMDSFNEYLTNLASNQDDAVVEKGGEVWEGKENWTAKQMELLKPLVAQLESYGLVLNERIMEQSKRGLEYWNLERKLCSALAKRKEISIDDVNRAMNLRSSDFQLMNLLLYQLRGKKVNDLHMEFLSYSEFLAEVYDDMIDYEEDVIGNNFNILRMFVGIYGPLAAPAMLSKRIVEAQEKYDSLSKALDPDLILNYHRRVDEILTSRGGNKYARGNLSRMPIIPPVIVDEELYRSNFFKFK